MPQGVDPNDIYHNGYWYSRNGTGGPVSYIADPITGIVSLLASSSALKTSAFGAKIYKSSLGPVAMLSATGATCAVGISGNIAALSNAGVPWVYNGITKVWTSYAAISGIITSIRTMFVDSRGYIHLTPNGGGKVYRSIDGGQTYASTYTWAFAVEDTMSFTEDDQGTLWTHSYSYPTKSVELIKSTDGGATWTEVSSIVRALVLGVDAGSLQTLINRHIHCVHWDKYRGWLFISHGDAGSMSPLLVSTDRGASFQAWGSFSIKNNIAASRQCTVILTDANAIYYRADVGISVNDSNDDFGIYRAAHKAGSSINSLLLTAPVKVWSDVFSATSGRSIEGWSSMGGVTSDGIIWFNTNSALNYSGKIIAASDGLNWSEIYVTTAATGGQFGSVSASRAYASEYYSVTNKMFYGTSNDETIFGFSIVPEQNTPLTYSSLSYQWQPTASQVSKLYTDYETLPTPTSSGTDTGNAIDLANTVGPATYGVFSGAKCAKFTFTGTGSYSSNQWNNLLSGNSIGSELIIESRVFIEAASLSNNLVLCGFIGGSASIYIGCNASRQLRITNAGITNWSSVVSSQKETLMPLNKWFWLRAIVKTNATAGEVTVLIDGQIAFRSTGLKTVGDDLYQVNVGPAISAWTGNVWMDNTAAWVIPAASVPSKIEAGV